MAEILKIKHDVENSTIATRRAFCDLVEGLPKGFAIKKFGDSELPSEMDVFDKKDRVTFEMFKSIDDDISHLRCANFNFSHLTEANGGGTILGLPNARSEAKILDAADELWSHLIPDGHGFTYQYSGYAAEVGDPQYGQANSERVSRFAIIVNTSIRDETTGDLRPSVGFDVPVFLHLALLPGLTYRIALGEPTLKRFALQKAELEAVCHRVEERTAANGDPILACTVRPDPFDWEDSLERQRKLNRPDVFFDIAPLRAAFKDPIIQNGIVDRDDVQRQILAALKQIYGERFKETH